MISTGPQRTATPVSRPAVTLIEMVVSMSILSAVFGLVVVLLGQVDTLERRRDGRFSELRGVAELTRVLRRDVRLADSVRIDEGRLMLSRGDEPPTLFTVEDGQAVRSRGDRRTAISLPPGRSGWAIDAGVIRWTLQPAAASVRGGRSQSAGIAWEIAVAIPRDAVSPGEER